MIICPGVKGDGFFWYIPSAAPLGHFWQCLPHARVPQCGMSGASSMLSERRSVPTGHGGVLVVLPAAGSCPRWMASSPA